MLQSDFIAVTDNSHGRILQIGLKNGTVVKLPLSVKKPTGLAFDKSTMTFFYSDASEKAILSATLHGKNKKNILRNRYMLYVGFIVTLYIHVVCSVT